MKRTAPHRRARGKRLARRATRRAITEKPPRLLVQLALSGLLFVALIALKLLMPGHLGELRGTLGQWLVNDADFAAAFSAVGRAAGGEQPLGDSLSEAYTAVFGGADAREVSSALTDLSVSEQPPSDLTPQRALPDRADSAPHTLSFAYAAPLSGALTSPFGWREDLNTGEEAFHYGLDLAAAEGTPILAFADGTVAVVGESTLLGRYLTVDHADGCSSLYAHCSAVSVQSGQTVRLGDPIALVGSTGNATGAHLHFELHASGRYLDPSAYVLP